MVATELSEGLYRLGLGRYQAYLWRDGDRATLVDTGEVGSGALIVAALAEIGLSPDALERVVLTHFHDDHAGSAAEIAAFGVPVVAHAADAPVLRGEVPGPPPDFTPFERELHARTAAGLRPAPPVAVDVEVADGDVLDFGGGARVVSVPGHTDGSIALHLPEHGVLFTGDLIAEYEGEIIPGVFNLDAAEAARSFRKLAALRPTTACFGHGEPAIGNADALIGARAEALA
ncbi:MBL fold metallo-hydrolase [Actinomadura atramentaria]|uniref:MBL fold metallo-hydrolase n=1 Tax=Actinomadura atramentaria TaxID=1990 RepID=UPI0003A52E90|nr:MBL fold metallo-hydrolase [Actinomadura atramentaria]